MVADTDCRTLIMTAEAQNWLEENKMEVTLKLYRYLLNDHLGHQTIVTSNISDSNLNEGKRSG